MTIVLCHGVFDIVHPGHLEHFRQARIYGDRLIVAIVADAYVRKGPGRPIHDQERRADFLRAIRVVDEVVIVDASDAMPILKALEPDVYCKGPDYASPTHPFAKDFQREKAFVEGYGGKVVITEGFTSSSSKMINAYQRIGTAVLSGSSFIYDAATETYVLQS